VVSTKQRIERLQRRLTKSGYMALSDTELIELLLNLITSDKNCVQKSREAIKKFKSLRGVLRSLPEELQQVKGIDARDAFIISLAREIARKFLKERIAERPIYQSGQEIFDFLYYEIRDLEKEVFKVIYLDSRKQIMEAEDLFTSLTDKSTAIHPREVMERAVKNAAMYLVFIHNHPSGNPNPSRADREITRDLVYAGMIMQVRVLDHIIIGENRYFSFAGEGLIEKYEGDFLHLKISNLARERSIASHF
jgi:DNA repair protein RadC